MKSNTVISYLIVTVAILFQSECKTDKPKSNQYIYADHPNIELIGRFDKTNPKAIEYDFPAVQIKARFSGTSIAVRLFDTLNYYNIVLDNKKTFIAKPVRDSIFFIAKNLTDTIHTIKIIKRTEASVGKGIFFGFIIDNEANLLPPEKPAKRRIEFIGNSITCGYGNEGAREESFKASTENSYYSYASILARKFRADFSMIAYSGKGLIRNYNERAKTSPEPMPALYNRVMVSKPELKWDFKKWSPDLVFINLGTNDYSTQPYPNEEEFIQTYINFINRIRLNYPPIEIICVSGPVIGDPCSSIIKKVVEKYQKDYNFNKIHFILLPQNILTRPDDLGADAHPNVMGQKKMADFLTPKVSEIMKWELKEKK
jgi:lysophospholipase L1-like esterase